MTRQPTKAEIDAFRTTRAHVEEWPAVTFSATLRGSHRIHARNPEQPAYTMCGRDWTQATYTLLHAAGRAITCKRCAAVLRRHQRHQERT
jgi:hypothetical protein